MSPPLKAGDVFLARGTGLKRVLVGVGLCVVLVGCSAAGPVLRPYKRNYMGYSYNISPNDTTAAPENNRSELQIQVSVRQDIPIPYLENKNRIALAYTNLSYWQLFIDSAPFRTTNHEPELFYERDLFSFHKLRFGVIHQSNGEDGTASRGWNRVFAEYVYASDGWENPPDIPSNRWRLSGNRWRFSGKLWRHFLEDRKNNGDIDDFMGFGELTGEYSWGCCGTPQVGLILRNHLRFRGENRGAVEAHASAGGGGFRVFVQYFYGFGESILDYNHRANRFTAGIEMTR
ncbi:MAG: phospholipase A [Planctomycetota bacterium]|nr:phospholipase A [Planctomycetota bacterium]